MSDVKTINNINDFDEAKIEYDENGNVKDISLALYANSEMTGSNPQLNLVDINKLPYYKKRNIDKKIQSIEELITKELQNKKIIGKIYDSETGKERNLTLSEISQVFKDMNGQTYEVGSKTKLIGTYKDIQDVINSGIESICVGDYHPLVNPIRCIKINDEYYEDTLDESAHRDIINMNNSGISYINNKEEEIKVENYFATNIYPWNKMKKVQITETDDGSDFNYDMTVDKGGNYFTEVPLYYIKQEFVIENTKDSTANYHKLNITTNWDSEKVIGDTESIFEVIPKDVYLDGNISNDYSLYMYKWVSKDPLPGYRPAQFFIKNTNAVVTKVDNPSTYDNLYILVTINGKTYYYLYKNYINLENKQYLNFNTLEYYNISETADSNGTNINIITTKHYVACYETSVHNGSLVSRPVTDTNYDMYYGEKFNKYFNYDSKYKYLDMELYNDFFVTLMDIEFNSYKPISFNSPDSYDPDFTQIKKSSYYPGGSSTKYFFSNLPKDLIIENNDYFIWGQGLLDENNCNNNILIYSNGNRPTRYKISRQENLIYDTDYAIEIDENGNKLLYFIFNNDRKNMVNITNVSFVDDIDSLGTDMSYKGIICDSNNILYHKYYSINEYTLDCDYKPRLLSKYFIETELSNIVSSYYSIDSALFLPGDVDNYYSRTIAKNSLDGTYKNRPFKWNWIENPYGNMKKRIYNSRVSGSASTDNVIIQITNTDKSKIVISFEQDYILRRKIYIASKYFDHRYPWISIPYNVNTSELLSYSKTSYGESDDLYIGYDSISSTYPGFTGRIGIHSLTSDFIVSSTDKYYVSQQFSRYE